MVTMTEPVSRSVPCAVARVPPFRRVSDQSHTFVECLYSAGYVRIYQNVETGQIAGYSWSLSDSKYYAVDSCRSLAVGCMR
jgi:hypothetical protein